MRNELPGRTAGLAGPVQRTVPRLATYRSVAMKTPRHQDILNLLRRRYDGPIMNNVSRGDYVECMIAITLGPDWRLSWADGWDWTAWDGERLFSGVRLEIKQPAVRQTCDRGRTPARRHPVFGIFRIPAGTTSRSRFIRRWPSPSPRASCCRRKTRRRYLTLTNSQAGTNNERVLDHRGSIRRHVGSWIILKQCRRQMVGLVYGIDTLDVAGLRSRLQLFK